eukprot:TRINITY_DN47446_c0_g1_i1.p1 TRINITY_DN47446_c0_g1~~TRINITY_DN47446_c0_g1_i1.p1  ORF type:complete len:864 (+),score=199.27 TRINITY_DN47446_c0_g1_i1:92-2683(+)
MAGAQRSVGAKAADGASAWGSAWGSLRRMWRQRGAVELAGQPAAGTTREHSPAAEAAAEEYLEVWRSVRGLLDALGCPGGAGGDENPATLAKRLRRMLRLLAAERGYSGSAPPCQERMLDSDVVVHLCRFAKTDAPHLQVHARISLHHIADVMLLAGSHLFGHYTKVVEPLVDVLQWAEQRRRAQQDADPTLSFATMQLAYAASWRLSQPASGGAVQAGKAAIQVVEPHWSCDHSDFFFVGDRPSSPRMGLSASGRSHSPTASPHAAGRSCSPMSPLPAAAAGGENAPPVSPTRAQVTTMGARGGGRKVIRAASPSTPLPRSAASAAPAGGEAAAPAGERRFVLGEVAAQGLSRLRADECVTAEEAGGGVLTAKDAARVLFTSDVAADALACILALRCAQVLAYVKRSAASLASVCAGSLGDLVQAALGAERRSASASQRLLPRLRLLDAAALHPAAALREAVAQSFAEAAVEPAVRAIEAGGAARSRGLALAALLAAAQRAPLLLRAVCAACCRPPVLQAALSAAAAEADEDAAAAALRLCCALLRGAPRRGFEALVRPWVAAHPEPSGAPAAASSVDSLVHPSLRRDPDLGRQAERRDAQAAQLRAAMRAAGEEGKHPGDGTLFTPRPHFPLPQLSCSGTGGASGADPTETLVDILVRRFAAFLRQPLEVNLALADLASTLLLCGTPQLTLHLVGSQQGQHSPAPGTLPAALEGLKKQVENSRELLGREEFEHQLLACRAELGLLGGGEADTKGANIQHADHAASRHRGAQAVRSAAMRTHAEQAALQEDWRPDPKERRLFAACCVLEEWRRDCAAVLRATGDAKLVASMINRPQVMLGAQQARTRGLSTASTASAGPAAP